jgi:hypothetical protein
VVTIVEAPAEGSAQLVDLAVRRYRHFKAHPK